MTSARMAVSQRRWGLTALVACLLPPLFETLPVWRDPLHEWAGIKWDPAQGMWWLHWVPFSLVNGQSPLFADSLNYPFGVNAFWGGASSPMLGLIGAPLTYLGNAILTYNVLLFIGFVLTGWLTYLAATKLIQRRWPAVVAGLLVEISPLMIGHGASDLDLVFLPAFPVTFLLLHEVLRKQGINSRRAGLCLAAVFVIQFLIAEEALAVLIASSAIGVCVSVVVTWRDLRPKLGYLISVVAWTACSGAVVALPLLWFQFFGAGAVRSGIPGRDAFGADLGNLLVPSRVQLLSPNALLFDPFESALYIGLPLAIIIVLVFVKLRHRRDSIVIATTALLIALLALGPELKIFRHDTGITLPWAALSHLPLVGDIQAQRMTLGLDFMLVLLLAIFLDEMRSRRYAKVVAALAIAAWLPVFPFPETQLTVPRYFYDAERQLPRNQVALVVPFSSSWASVDAMIWQEQSGMWFRMPEGYFYAADASGKSTYGPPPTLLGQSLLALGKSGDALPLDVPSKTVMRGELKALGVSSVIVGPMSYQTLAVSDLTALLGCPPQRVEGVVVWTSIREGACV